MNGSFGRTSWLRCPWIIALLVGLLGAGCTSIPQRELQAYRQAMDEARVQFEHVLADHAAARQWKSNLAAQVNLQRASSARSLALATRLGLENLEGSNAADEADIQVRLKAWEVVSRYNEALTAVATGAKTQEIETAVNGFLSSLQNFPIKEVARMGAEAAPYGSIVVGLIDLLQREIEARHFRQAVLAAEMPMKDFVGLLRSDAKLFHAYRVALLNERFREQEIGLFDRADRFRVLTTAHEWSPTSELAPLIKQVNQNRILTAGIETFPPIPEARTGTAPATANAEMSELRGLADAIERDADLARATVTELGTYHELMRRYTLLLDELERKFAELTAAARQGNRHLPSPDQLQQVISSVRLAHDIYTRTH